MRQAALVLALGVFASACSDDENSAEGAGGDAGDASGSVVGTCGLRADVSGAVSLTFTGKSDASCLTAHSSEAGLAAIFDSTTAEGEVMLRVADVTEGETGDFEVEVAFARPPQEHWVAACTTAITEHELLRAENTELGELRYYQVSGAGSCATELESGEDAEPVTLGPFAFRAQFTWRD